MKILAKRAARGLVALFALGPLGCGYQFAGTASRLADDVQTIAVGPILNGTREVGLERELVETIEDEIALRGRLRIAPPDQADVLLSGRMRSYDSQPVAYNANDEALLYQATLSVDLELRRRADGKLLWKTIGQRETANYGAVPGVVVTSSSQFQRSNLNARDVARFTDIQLAEGQRREANEVLVEDLAKTIYDQMMEDF